MALTDKELKRIQAAREAQQAYVNDAQERLIEVVDNYLSGENTVLTVNAENCDQLELVLPTYVNAQWQEIAMLGNQIRQARVERAAVAASIAEAEYDRCKAKGLPRPTEAQIKALVDQSQHYHQAQEFLGDLEEAEVCAKGFLAALETVKQLMPGLQGMRNRNIE